MQFLKQLYTTDDIKDSKLLRYRISRGKILHGLYLITICPGVDELEIYPCAILKEPYYKKYPFRIVGLAGDYDGSLRLVEEIVKDIYQKTGNYKLKSYLVKQFEKSRK